MARAVRSNEQRQAQRASPPPPSDLGGAIRNRVKEFRLVSPNELLDNERNWRLHPYTQVKAMQEILATVGIAGALTAYYSERNGGKLTLIDGHERKENHVGDWPTLILDVNDEEADLLLLTLDPLSAMADTDGSKLNDLLDNTAAGGTVALEDLLQSLRRSAAENGEEDEEGELEPGPRLKPGPPEMELLPFESYDYVVLLARTAQDWLALVDIFGIGSAGFTLPDGKRRKVGRGRVVDAAIMLKKLRGEEVPLADLGAEAE